MPSFFGKDFDKIVAWAKRWYPFTFRTVNGIVDEDGTECNGMAYEGRDFTWTIVIDRNRDFDSAVDTLVHEFAHVLDIASGGRMPQSHSSEHGPRWGRWHAKVYRELHTWLDQGMKS